MKFKKMKINKEYLLLLFVFMCSVTYAQKRSITGKVISSDDSMPLPAVSVVVKGTSTGSSTDFDGNYSIEVDGSNATLIFSYLGFTTQEVTVGTKNSVNITLKSDVNALDEIVVVGYGAVKKSDITGSVSSVNNEELTAFPVLDAAQALQGRAAGVAVQTNNGAEPGAAISIRIRGNTSISASSAALIVVDGFVGATMPQASDIESMEVLKDASATAIYGSRGANGVVLVTTKKGRKGKMSVEVNTSYSSQNVSNQLELLNADQFAAYQQAINPTYVQGPTSTDWQNQIYRAGSVSDTQLAFSGGTDNINYYVSGNYYKQKGVVVNSGFERFSFLSNIDAKINKKLKIGFNAFGNRSTKNGVSTQADTGGRGSGDVISGAYRFAPDLGVKDENGINTVNSVGDDIDNPYAVATESIDETVRDKYRANFYADYEIVPGLSFKTTLGYSAENASQGTFKPSTLVASAGDVGGIATISDFKRSNILSENYLTYHKEMGNGKLTALLGYSYQKQKTERNASGSQGFITNSVSFRNLGQGATTLTPTSSLSETEIVSQFARLNYDLSDRYLVTATVRRDGASNFAANEKYAVFPSGALGWKISNEEFLKESNTISNLKLRASYGVTGNPSIDPYQSLASYSDIYAVVGDQTVNAVVPNQLSNPNLKWESSYQTNFGVDLGMYQNRISLSVDYYTIDTKDVILPDTSTPEYAGFLNSTSYRNIGEINNSGFEIALGTKNIVTENFSWSTEFNWSRNRNTVKKLIGGEDVFLDSAPGHFLQDETHILREGEAVGQFFGYEYRGVNQGGTLPEGTASFSNTPGEELFTDINGDGVITTDDRKIIGDPNQDWTFGFNNTFRYKNFDLGVFFQGAYGGELFSYTLLELASGGSNATTEALRAWTPTNTDTNVPSAAVREKRISSRFVYDGSYIRLKNIALGYNLPSQILEKIHMDNVRFSISGQNLLTFTDYPGTDPEASYQSSGNQGGNVNQGFEYGNYPNIKSVTFSLNLKF